MSLVNFYVIVIFLGLSVLYLCLLQNQSNYDLFNMRSLQRVWRCHQTNFVLDKGGVKISTRNRPLSPLGIISWTELVSLRLVH